MAAPHRVIAPSSGHARSETTSADPPSAKRATPRLVGRGKIRSLITVRPSPPKTSTDERSPRTRRRTRPFSAVRGPECRPAKAGWKSERPERVRSTKRREAGTQLGLDVEGVSRDAEGAAPLERPGLDDDRPAPERLDLADGPLGQEEPWPV